MNNDKRWRVSCLSSFVGIIFVVAFTLFTLGADDNWGHAIIQIVLLLGSFIFIFVVPDKIIFGKYLVKREIK